MNSPQSIADQIWSMIDQFRGYSFCKAHSAAYSRVSYESAYLRCHHPAEFMAAVISNGGGYYSTSAYISECLRMGIEILPPDVNHSDILYKGFKRSIRIGLLAVKGLNTKTAQTIVHERKTNGRYLSLYDYLHRTQTDFAENQKLNQLNAFADISPHNASQIYWQMHEYYQNKNDYGQQHLFAPGERTPPPLNPPTISEQYKNQINLLGYLINRHPLLLYETQIKNSHTNYLPSTAIPLHINKKITLIGLPITQKPANTKSGERMAFYSFEDQYSIYDVTLFPKIYEEFHHLITSDSPCFLHGLVESLYGAETITIDWIKKIADA